MINISYIGGNLKVTFSVILVNSLIETSLRGVDSHGVNLFPHYCRAVKSGRINSTPNIKIKQTGTSSAIVDADHAFGHHVGAVAIDNAINLSKETGIAAVNVKKHEMSKCCDAVIVTVEV